jgi:uncharacterized protein YjbJ (UPF0337 family)
MKKGTLMNRNQVVGRWGQMTGTLKQMTGRALGNRRLESRGRAQAAVGKVEAAFGDAVEQLKGGARRAIDRL